MKNKGKLIGAAVLAVALIAAALALSRLIGRAMLAGVDQLQAAAEAPLPTEEIWVAPTPEPQEDFVQVEAEALESLADPSPPLPEEEEGLAPILESPEQLAETADQCVIVDENPDGD